MKKIQLLCFVLFCFLGINTAQAQRGISCSPDLSCTGNFGAVCPTTLPTATSGTFYSTTVTFYFPDTASFAVPVIGGTVDAEVDSVLVEITNLPAGLSFYCGSNGNCWFPVDALNRHGCAVIYGVPCEVADTFQFNFSFTLAGTVNVPIIGPVSGISPAALPFPATLPLVGTLPTLDIVSVSNTLLLCPTGTGSTIDLEASGGFDTYQWSNSASDSIITVGSAGVYTVSATHSTGCVVEDSIELANLTASATANTTICANTFFELTAEGGDSYSWSPSANLSDANISDPLILRGLTSDVTFTVTTSNGFCTETATVDIAIDNTCGLGICTECTLDTVGCAGAIPTVCSQLPPATAGAPYDESFTFFFPSVFDLKALLPQAIKDVIQAQGGAVGIDTNSIPAFPVSQFYIELTNLPQGFSWESDQSGGNNFYYPNKHSSAQYGCVSVCGNDCDVAGDYLTFVVYAEAPANIITLLNTINPLLGIVGVSLPITVQGNYLGIPLPLTSLTFDYVSTLTVTPDGSTEITEGDTLGLEANTGFTDYVWSTGETTTNISVTEPGTYVLSATDANGCVQVVETEVTLFSSIADLNAFDQSLNIFPNPNTGNFSINFVLAKNQIVNVEMINLQGQVVSTQSIKATTGSNSLPVNVSSVAKGIYFVKIQTIDGAITRRVSVQ